MADRCSALTPEKLPRQCELDEHDVTTPHKITLKGAVFEWWAEVLGTVHTVVGTGLQKARLARLR